MSQLCPLAISQAMIEFLRRTGGIVRSCALAIARGEKSTPITRRLLDRNNHLQSCSLCKLLLAMIEGHESFLFQFQSARYVQNV